MIGLTLALLLSSLGGTIILHYLKNYFLREKLRLRWDWDGLVERALISALIIRLPQYLWLVPLIILIKVFIRLFWLQKSANLLAQAEPGIVSQKVLYKSELAFDLIISPALAILVGVTFR
jgi:hypothetical protein